MLHTYLSVLVLIVPFRALLDLLPLPVLQHLFIHLDKLNPFVPWWFARLSAEQFQFGGLGSCSGQELSHASTYHGAGSNGSCAAFGATYAKNGRSPPATLLIQSTVALPMREVA